MNGEVVCQSAPVTVLSCSKPLSGLHGEKTALRLTQDDRRSPVCLLQSEELRLLQSEELRLLQSEGRMSHGAVKPELMDVQRSAPSLLLSNGSLWAPLHNNHNHNNHNNNNNIINNHNHHHHTQRRGPRARAMGKMSTRRISGIKNSQNRKVTDFYPIRRSSRKSKSELKDEQKKLLDDLITNGIEEGMEVQLIEGKGRAVFATRCFQKGDYVVEYHGDLLHITDAKEREAEYAQNPATGCYMYYFQYLCKTYCVDATRESGRMGRLINHSKNGNCQTKLHDINGVPHLILVASRDIDTGEELLYDYGDRSKASIDAHPWLKY